MSAFFLPTLLLCLLIIHSATIARLQLLALQKYEFLLAQTFRIIKIHLVKMETIVKPFAPKRTNTQKQLKLTMPETFFPGILWLCEGLLEQILSIFVAHFVGIVRHDNYHHSCGNFTNSTKTNCRVSIDTQSGVQRQVLLPVSGCACETNCNKCTLQQKLLATTALPRSALYFMPHAARSIAAKR